MSVIGSNILAGAAGQGGGYTIERSLRLRSSASAYLSRTPASAGNRKTWTWSGWVKRGALGSLQLVFDASSSSTSQYRFGFNTTDTFTFYGYVGATNVNLASSAVYRDISAWYHLVVAMDTTQATSSNRVKVYINGEQVTSFGTAIYPALNHDTNINNNIAHSIGRRTYDNLYKLDGYLTEVNFIDGFALTPSDFGNYNEDTGVWQPAKYIGSYGTNGFYLPFSDNTTTTTLAEDASGNGNDWTPNNISLTSGATYDSMTDTPTPYADGGNYAVLNPLQLASSSGYTVLDGNLKISGTNPANATQARGTIAVSSGKWYWEVLQGSTTSAGGPLLGVVKSNFSQNTYMAGTSDAWLYYAFNGQKFNGSSAAYGATWTTNDIIGVALDMDGGTITFYKNGTTQGTAFSNLSGNTVSPAISTDQSTTSQTVTFNFGQRPFAYTPPTGFKALHTGNLPDSAIVDGSEYFNTVLYTGNGTSQSVDGVGFQPDWVWIKKRTLANHALFDVLRGTSKVLRSDTTEAEFTASGVTSFNSDGFSLGSVEDMNSSSSAFVAWNWKANGAGVSNTDGSITSTVSANPTAGFSIVTYTGTGAAATVGHGLGVAPKMFICKNRTGAAGNWGIYNEAIGADNYLVLDGTNATINSPAAWNSTAPTSSVFTLGSGGFNINGVNYVAYCFAEVPGFSKFGSYTGNGSADGPFVFTNFRPAFLAFKRTDSTSDWTIHDNRRLGYNTNNFELYPSGSYAETGSTSSPRSEFFANGFKIRGTSGGINASGGTYIYMAFSENPFKNSLAR